nr:hypothetical protein [Tanacetum cinerariifolium]
MDQNVDFSGYDQIQNPQYPLSQENSLTNDEFEAYTNANDANMNDLQFKLDNFQKNQQDFQEKFEQMQDDLLNQMRNFMQKFYDGPPEAREEQEVKNVKEQSAERGSHSIQTLKNFKVVHKSSISSNTSQISSIHSISPILSTKEPENLLSMGYEHLSITPKTESDEVTESNAENLLQIPKDKECDLPIFENSPVCDNHSDTFSDSKIDDDISVYDDDFEDIDIEEENGVEEENVVQQEEEEVDFEDISRIQDVVLREKLLSITRLISNIESLNENSTPDHVLNSFESDNSLLDNFLPEFETVCHHSEETRSGNTTHADYSLPEYDLFCFEIEPGQERRRYSFLEELLIDDSILFYESFDSNFEDNPSIPRPPPEPPDAETDVGEEIPVVMIDKDKFDDDSQFFMFDKVFSLLSAKSEDTIFDPGFFPSD